MGYIYVFGPNDDENDYSSMGLAGDLEPKKCVFKEVANGESCVELEHPVDAFGKYTYLQPGNILIVPVPVRTTPEIQNGKFVTTVWKYKVRDASQLSSSKQRTLYKSKTGSSKLRELNPGETLTVVEVPTHSWDVTNRG